jgi:hypothetical protein
MRKNKTFGYLTAEELGIRNNIAILPCGSLDSEQPALWTAEDLKPYASYMPEDRALDSLFGGFVFKPVLSSGRRYFDPLYVGFRPPANRQDWEEWILDLFREGVQLHALAEAGSDRPDVWITLPYPHPHLRDFGNPYDPARESLNFTRNQDRLEALKWWIGEWLEAWSKHRSIGQKLRFAGFVWPRDSIGSSDLQLVKTVNAHLRSLGLKSMWICNYGSLGADQWKRLGFDAAVVYSNYTGTGPYDIGWLRNACLFAKAIRTGFLIVKGRGVIYSEGHFDDYLRCGLPENQDFMGAALKVYSFPQHSLTEWMRSEPEQYEKLYRFIKGTFRG